MNVSDIALHRCGDGHGFIISDLGIRDLDGCDRHLRGAGCDNLCRARGSYSDSLLRCEFLTSVVIRKEFIPDGLLEEPRGRFRFEFVLPITFSFAKHASFQEFADFNS